MGFVRKKRKIGDFSREIDYLNSIGYADPMGNGASNYCGSIVVDEENDCFLLMMSGLSSNWHEVSLTYYVLCVKGVPVTLTVAMAHRGRAADCSAEFSWIIKAIGYPEGQDEIENIRELITEAFTADSYFGPFTRERVRNVTVSFECE